ncbi:MFS transporter [Catellatospora sp. TT07R-123]|uniref:MFS transporter n=1 Tax=Catellatospora sp. TT07R-123 TaxID=2733863 RepID=UPI001B2AA041|nr:MFS transporter [Catellatospora sp. TT07R-123]GHJ46510.1 MFS transporter [Catellatospora sp. TT07R-123]
MGVRENLVPPAGVARQLAVQSLLFGVGQGTFLTGSAVFFTRVVGLRPHEIGLGLSAAAATALLLSVPLSSLADRLGPLMLWSRGVALQGLLFAVWPLVRGFATFLVVIVAVELLGTVAQAGRSVYLIEALDPKERVRTLAFSRSWLNVGWSLGAGLAALALAIDARPAYYAMVLVNSVLLLGNAVFIARLPGAGQRREARAERPRVLEVFRDRPYLAVTAVCAVMGCFVTVELEVAPLWLLHDTDAPRWWLGVLTLINTLMATTLQVALTSGTHTLPGAVRALRLGGVAAAVGCPVYLLAGGTSGWLTMALLAVATVLLTLCELLQSAGAWTLMAELPPAERRGAYLGAYRMGTSAQMMIGPAALIALAVSTGGWGWLVIAGLFAVGALIIGPVVGRAADSRPSLRATAPATATAA